MLGKLAGVIALIGVLFSSFTYFALKECENFQISNQNGKIFIVTGGNSGLGYETVKSLANAGGTVILASRSLTKGNEAKKNILESNPNSKIDVVELDLSSFSSIRKFTDTIKEKYDHIDVLINNAGVMALPNRESTKDGLEMQIGTNHFGHFLLTSLIYPLLSKNGRVINHSSGAYIFASKDFPEGDIQSLTKYSPWNAYGNSKLSNLLFTYELNRRLELISNPKNIVSIAVHPGYSATNLQQGKFPMWETMNSLFAMKAEYGAQAQILAAVGEGVGEKPLYGTMIGPKYAAIGAPAIEKIHSNSVNENALKKLWDVSNEITGANFLN